LRGGCNVRLGENGRRPCNVAHPVCVSWQNLGILPAPSLLAELPQLDLAVAAASDKPPRSTGLVPARANDLSRRYSRCPRYTVHAAATCLEDLVCPVVVLELEYRDVAVGGGAGEEATGFVRCPGDKVDRRGVQGDVVDFLPGRGLFPPDKDLAVVRAGCEDVAVLWVCPCYAPYGALVSSKPSATASPWYGTTYPRSVSTSVCLSPSTSKILIVLSEEHVARRRP
jgi:hypothetical protein